MLEFSSKLGLGQIKIAERLGYSKGAIRKWSSAPMVEDARKYHCEELTPLVEYTLTIRDATWDANKSRSVPNKQEELSRLIKLARDCGFSTNELAFELGTNTESIYNWQKMKFKCRDAEFFIDLLIESTEKMIKVRDKEWAKIKGD
jgi:DNA-binding transcriptional regulator YiaG